MPRSTLLIAALLLPVACTSLVGLDTLTFSGAGGAGGGVSDGGGGLGGDATGGEGGAGFSCTPGEETACYDGPVDTRGVGECMDGTGTCNATGDGVEQCNGAVLPAIERCEIDGDEDCNSLPNDHCATFARLFQVTGTENVHDIAVGPNDAFAIVGSVRGQVNLGSGNMLDCDDNTGFLQTFVTVFEEDGTFRWAACWGATDTVDELRGVAFESSGDVVVSGHFEGTITAPNLDHTAAGTRDMLVVRLDGATGAVLASLQDGSSGATTQTESLAAVPGTNDVVMAGVFDGTVNPGSLLTADAQDIYVARLDATNGVVWAHHITAPADQNEPRVAIAPGGDVIVTGRYESALTIGTTALPSTTGVFIARLDGSTGTASWATAIDADNGEHIWDVSVDASTILVSGRFASDITFNTMTIPAIGADDMFVAMLEASDGGLRWGQTWGFTGRSHDAFAVIHGPGDTVLFGGELIGTIDFGGGDLVGIDVDPSHSDALMVSLDSDGIHRWSRSFMGTEDDDVDAFAVDSQGRLLVAGETNSTIDFGTGELFGDGIWVARVDP